MRFQVDDGEEIEVNPIPSIGSVIDKSIEFLLMAGYSFREIAEEFGRPVVWVQRRVGREFVDGKEDIYRPSVADVYHRLDDVDWLNDNRGEPDPGSGNRSTHEPNADVDPRHRNVKPNSHYIKQLFQNGYKPREIAEVLRLSPADVRDCLKLDGLL